MNRCPKRTGEPWEGRTLELDVENVAHGGSCVARHEGRVVFVRHTLPGERVVARVTEGTSESKFLRADAIDILEASAHRVEAPCPYAAPGLCGGCDWQQAAIPYQRELKRQVVIDTMKRIAHLDVDLDVAALPSSPDGLRWRRRLDLAVADGVPGLRGYRSHDVIEIEDCLIADAAFEPAFTERFESSVKGFDLVRPSVGDIVGIELPLAQGEKVPPVTEIVESQHGSAEFEVSALGFWQVHPDAAATFVDAVLDASAPQPGETCLDLYCGVGLFARALADCVGESGRVVGVEAGEEAIHYARSNMAGARHVDLIAADVAKAHLPVERADVVVLDPPRAGAGREVVETVVDLGPRVVVYVACDPAALARDVAYFGERGYEMTSLQGYDAFPMTHHVECIAVLRPTEA